MKHYTYDEWLSYVKNEVSFKTREELESHLYTCDQCLEHYLQAVTEHESSLPVLSNENSFTDLVMAGVSKQKEFIEKPSVIKQPVKVKKAFYQQAAFHYIIAAAATLLLTFSGVFQSLATYASAVEATQHLKEKKPSVTEGVIDKTFAWMDSLEKKEANKK
ncbi:anti-sigma factor family protein [Neobacillus niacini]|uniref:anti-sigma factor family protein n=1 Tax=Neobacillus niacini TaxID=86668 RepID=UPI003983379C